MPAGRCWSPKTTTTSSSTTGTWAWSWPPPHGPAQGALVAAFARGGAPVLVHPARLSAVQTVHAMTVHRSQGSQFERVSVLLPPASSPLLTRELLYTAVTGPARTCVSSARRRPFARPCRGPWRARRVSANACAADVSHVSSCAPGGCRGAVGVGDLSRIAIDGEQDGHVTPPGVWPAEPLAPLAIGLVACGGQAAPVVPAAFAAGRQPVPWRPRRPAERAAHGAVQDAVHRRRRPDLRSGRPAAQRVWATRTRVDPQVFADFLHQAVHREWQSYREPGDHIDRPEVQHAEPVVPEAA